MDIVQEQTKGDKIDILNNGDTLVTFLNGTTAIKKNNEYIINGDIVLTPSGTIRSSTQYNYKRWVFPFTSSGTHQIYAVINFPDNYYRNVPPITVNVSNFPMVSDIDMFKYCQGSGEYHLKAVVPNDQTVTTEWYCYGNVAFYEIPFPYDASFLEYPNFFTAIDFYSTGLHNISTNASNSYGSGDWFTKSFYVYDVKSNLFPLAIHPNPMVQGTKPQIDINENSTTKNESLEDELVFVNIYSGNKKIMHNKSSKNKNTIDLSHLSKSKYIVSVKMKHKLYNTTLEVI